MGAELTDQQLINPHMLVATKAEAARTKLHSWMHWTLLNFPNLGHVLRSDHFTGEVKLLNIPRMNKFRASLAPEDVIRSGNDDGSSFSMGRYACPGQSLART